MAHGAASLEAHARDGWPFASLLPNRPSRGLHPRSPLRRYLRPCRDACPDRATPCCEPLRRGCRSALGTLGRAQPAGRPEKCLQLLSTTELVRWCGRNTARSDETSAAVRHDGLASDEVRIVARQEQDGTHYIVRFRYALNDQPLSTTL